MRPDEAERAEDRLGLAHADPGMPGEVVTVDAHVDVDMQV
jgi:hypothetical protein